MLCPLLYDSISDFHHDPRRTPERTHVCTKIRPPFGAIQRNPAQFTANYRKSVRLRVGGAAGSRTGTDGYGRVQTATDTKKIAKAPRLAEACICLLQQVERETMISIVESLCESAELKAGHRVKTLRGATRGRIVRLLGDARVVWQPKGSKSEWIALPDSVVRAD